MSLNITNQQVMDFYKEHPMLNFENMNILLVEILDKLFSEISPDMDNNFGLSMIKEIKNISSVMNTMQNFKVKFLKMKKEYHQDLQLILNNGNSEDSENELPGINEDELVCINDEYRVMVNQKLNVIKTIKEFSKKLITDMETINLPTLTGKYNKNTEWKCIMCEYIGKNKGALSSHVKKHQREEA